MPRYAYKRILVLAYDQREFTVNELRPAIEYLKSLPGANDAPYVGLCAEVSTGGRWPDGKIMFRLLARPFLRLPEIIGKTPPQVWELLDNDVDDQRRGLVDRCAGKKGYYREYLGID